MRVYVVLRYYRGESRVDKVFGLHGDAVQYTTDCLKADTSPALGYDVEDHELILPTAENLSGNME